MVRELAVAVKVPTEKKIEAWARDILVEAGVPDTKWAKLSADGTFSGDLNESVTGTTNGSGQVTLTSNGKKKLPITYIFCVDNVSESGHTYAPGNNIETCDSY